MNMATTTTVQRDDAAECRAAFEQWLERTVPLSITEKITMFVCWQAAWKAAKGV